MADSVKIVSGLFLLLICIVHFVILDSDWRQNPWHVNTGAKIVIKNQKFTVGEQYFGVYEAWIAQYMLAIPKVLRFYFFIESFCWDVVLR